MVERAVHHCLGRLADFEGRTSREQFMPFANAILLPLLIVSALGAAGYIVVVTSEGEAAAFRGAYWPDVIAVIVATCLALVLTAIALLASATVRRLHDAGKSGWWYGAPAATAATYCILYAGGKLGLDSASLLLTSLELPMRMAAFATWMILMVYLRLPSEPHSNIYGPPPPDDAPDSSDFNAAAERVDARIAALLTERSAGVPVNPSAAPRRFGRRR